MSWVWALWIRWTCGGCERSSGLCRCPPSYPGFSFWFASPPNMHTTWSFWGPQFSESPEARRQRSSSSLDDGLMATRGASGRASYLPGATSGTSPAPGAGVGERIVARKAGGNACHATHQCMRRAALNGWLLPSETEVSVFCSSWWWSPAILLLLSLRLARLPSCRAEPDLKF